MLLRKEDRADIYLELPICRNLHISLYMARIILLYSMGFLVCSVVKNLPGDSGSIPEMKSLWKMATHSVLQLGEILWAEGLTSPSTGHKEQHDLVTQTATSLERGHLVNCSSHKMSPLIQESEVRTQEALIHQHVQPGSFRKTWKHQLVVLGNAFCF